MDNMERQLLPHVPKTWDNNGRDRNLVQRFTTEYEQLEALFRINNCKVNRIERYENIYRYAQFLVCQQLLIALQPNKKYYTVRKYAHVSSSDVDKAVQYQLDKRYMPQLDTSFQTTIGHPHGNEVFVLSVATTNIDGPFTSERDSDFYIEYIVYLD